MKDSVARIDKDVGNKNTIVSGAKTVIINDNKTAFATSATNVGSTIIAPSTTVFIEDKGIARESDGLSDGGVVNTGSTNVFAGK